MMGVSSLGMERQQGIPINLISRESLEDLGSEERVDFVLNEVKDGKVLILEMGLNAMEEATLIEHTMRQIDHETFIGIEIQSYANSMARQQEISWFDRILKRRKPPRMAVIGPANLLRTIHKDGNVIQTMLITREQVIDSSGDTSGKSEIEKVKTFIPAIERDSFWDIHEDEGIMAADEDSTVNGDEDTGQRTKVIPFHEVEEYGAAEGGN